MSFTTIESVEIEVEELRLQCHEAAAKAARLVSSGERALADADAATAAWLEALRYLAAKRNSAILV